MTRIGFIADVHVANWRRFGGPVVNGLNRRARETIETIRQAGVICRKERVDALVVLGDLFDHPHPNPTLVRATAEALLTCADDVHVLLGNHDMRSDGEWDHACSSMGLSSAIHVVSEPKVEFLVGGAKLFMCPYRPGLASEWLPGSLAKIAADGPREPKGNARIVCTHLGIWDEATPAYLKAAKDAVGIGQLRWLCDAHNIDAVFAGNWHGFKQWGWGLDSPRIAPASSSICIPGALCPQGWQEADQSRVGSLVVLDTAVRAGSQNAAITRHVVPGPRWLSVDLPPEGLNVGGATGVPHQYVRLQVKKADVARALAQKAVLDEQPERYTCVVQVVGDDDEQLARDAAARARMASTPEHAVELFASGAKVDEPGTLDGVMRRLADYRKGAAE